MKQKRKQAHCNHPPHAIGPLSAAMRAAEAYMGRVLSECEKRIRENRVNPDCLAALKILARMAERAAKFSAASDASKIEQAERIAIAPGIEAINNPSQNLLGVISEARGVFASFASRDANTP